MRFVCLLLPFYLFGLLPLYGQSPLDSTRNGYARGKAGLMLKRSLDMANTPGSGHYHQSEKNTEKLQLPEEAQDFTPVFADEFDSLNINIWQVGQPWGRYHGQQPHQYYGDSEVFVKNGVLYLLNRYAPQKFPSGDTGITIPYGTGLINTANSRTFQFGFFAIRSKNPSGPATWPAFWLTGKNNWPPEIDIYEMYGKSTGKTIHRQTMTLHFGKIETRTKTHLMKAVNLSPNTDSAFHIYACLWTPDRVVFYTDGVPVRSINMNKWMRQFYQEPMYLVVNNAVDHRYLQHIDNSRLPVSLEVDWIRVYAPAKP
ncbi:MAG: glycoside hydrolase family 16 protein [Sphingomonadales bacterium]|nr:glycoside hydrolase family 16 protein [Sphingomonadales bacterium]